MVEPEQKPLFSGFIHLEHYGIHSLKEHVKSANDGIEPPLESANNGVDVLLNGGEPPLQSTNDGIEPPLQSANDGVDVLLNVLKPPQSANEPGCVEKEKHEKVSSKSFHNRGVNLVRQMKDAHTISKSSRSNEKGLQKESNLKELQSFKWRYPPPTPVKETTDLERHQEFQSVVNQSLVPNTHENLERAEQSNTHSGYQQSLFHRNVRVVNQSLVPNTHENLERAEQSNTHSGYQQSLFHRNVRAQTISELNNNELQNLFVKPSNYKSAKEILMKEGRIFIVGPHGTGKTMMAYRLMNSVCSRNRDLWKPLILKFPDQFRQLVHPDSYDVILMDNIFGECSFDNEAFKMLKQIPNDSTIVKNKYYIFTIRTEIFNDGYDQICNKFPLYKRLCYFNIISELKDAQFNIKEKENMLSNHINYFKLNKKISKTDKEAIIDCKSNEYFPVCCKLLCKYPRLQVLPEAVSFFERPVMYLKDEIRELYKGNEKDKAKYGALILTMAKKGKLPIKLLDDFHKLEAHDELHSYLRTVGISDHVPLSTIRDAAKHLFRSYLKKDGQYLTFLNSSVHDAVSLVYGESCPDHLLDVCTVSFLHEYVVSSDDPGNYLKLRIDTDIVTQRFITEIRDGHADQVCTHPAFSEKSFVKDFKKICKDLNSLNMLTSAYPDSIPLLYWAVWSKNGEFFEYVMQYHMKVNKNLNQNIVNKIVTACCMTGNVAALQHVDKNLNIDLLEIASTNVPVPYILSNSQAYRDPCIHVGQLIHTACFYGYIQILKYLLNKAPDKRYINAQDSFGRTPCCIAAKHGHVEIFQELLRLNCDLTLKTRSGNCPIHEACMGGQTEIVKIILLTYKNHDLKFIENSDGRTPLELTVMSGHVDLLQFLLGQEGIYSHKWERDSLILHLACELSSKSMVLKMLCESLKNMGELKRFINKGDRNGNTPLHIACKTVADVDRVEMLIEFGANKNSLNNRGQTPLDLAFSLSCKDLIKTLISHGARSAIVDSKHSKTLEYNSKYV